MTPLPRVDRVRAIAKLAQSRSRQQVHVDLRRIEDPPAVVGLDGILDAIQTLAADLADDG